MCPLVPESVPFNCTFLFNIKFKIKKWMVKESESLPSTKRITNSGLLHLTEPPTDLFVPTNLDSQPANFIQDASRYARQLLQVSLKTGNYALAMKHFLNFLSEKYLSTFGIALNGVGSPCGFVLQSSI
jgi:hypothetical protein